MTRGSDAQLQARLEALFEELGLKIGPEEADQVAGLQRHFAASRAKLAAADLGETEPATGFSVDTAQPGRDHERT
jgi:hypothetical protein